MYVLQDSELNLEYASSKLVALSLKKEILHNLLLEYLRVEVRLQAGARGGPVLVATEAVRLSSSK